MPLVERKYKFDQTILSIYGFGDQKKIKLTLMRCMRTAGLDDLKEHTLKGSINDSKLIDNISRAKSRIFELAFCNSWDWFFTGTLDSSKYNRQDLVKYHTDFTRFLHRYGKYHGFKIDFLVVPELHSDGKSWHIHGFLAGLPASHLVRFAIGDKMGKKLADKVKNGDLVYNWSAYAKKFGFCDLEPIRSHEAVSKYIQKYINKGLASSVTELGAHLYYHSRGLNYSQLVKKGTMAASIVPTYENEYCAVSWLDYSDELLDTLLDSFVDDKYYQKHCNTDF